MELVRHKERRAVCKALQAAIELSADPVLSSTQASAAQDDALHCTAPGVTARSAL